MHAKTTMKLIGHLKEKELNATLSQTLLEVTPQYLLICFKRYNNRGDKDGRTLTVPEKLKVAKDTHALHALVFHDGKTIRSGHYWVETYNRERDKVYRLNDTRVTKKRALSRTSREVYVALYIKLE